LNKYSFRLFLLLLTPGELWVAPLRAVHKSTGWLQVPIDGAVRQRWFGPAGVADRPARRREATAVMTNPLLPHLNFA
jgi:hypothetical protein